MNCTQGPLAVTRVPRVLQTRVTSRTNKLTSRMISVRVAVVTLWKRLRLTRFNIYVAVFNLLYSIRNYLKIKYNLSKDYNEFCITIWI